MVTLFPPYAVYIWTYFFLDMDFIGLQVLDLVGFLDMTFGDNGFCMIVFWNFSGFKLCRLFTT